jgi:uncharacterized protein YlxW (UPF0749 family)
LTLAAATFVTGLLIAAQLQTEAPRVRYSSQERPPLVEAASELQVTQEELKDRIVGLRGDIQEAERSASGSRSLVAGLNRDLRDARLAAGLIALVGPGVVLELNDSPGPAPENAPAADYLVSASDLRDVVVELWLAGAEAVSVNGERIAVGTALTDIGSSVLVNSAYLQPPYQISAIGPADMEVRLSSSPSFQRFLQERAEAYGLSVGIATPEEVAVPAYVGRIGLVESRPLVPGASAIPGPAATP